MIQVVNGYVCMDCADVALAKKDINPAHPPNSPDANPQSASSNGQTNSNGQTTPAVTFGGSLSQLSGANAVQQPGATSASSLNPGQANPAQAPTTPQPYNPQNGQKLSVYA
ncbi:MAG TPA: hypothetical protein VHZ26_02880 [Caulobacteraceae bacterium]|nr:hypothetical protein [Caulobacteraceae bacterium]